MPRLRVAVLYGGRSAEHEISLISAANVISGLDPERYEVLPVAIHRSGVWQLDDRSLVGRKPTDMELPELLSPSNAQPVDGRGLLELGVDVVFPVLHGPFGEDGTIQGLLKLADLPFVGSSVLGSAVAMDKDVAKRLLHAAGIPTSRHRAYQSAAEVDGREVEREFGFPLFVKPANMGSSVGVSRALDQNGLMAAVDEAFLYDRKVVIEENVAGREIECAVLGNQTVQTSILGEILPKDGFYSYAAKYVDDSAGLQIPADLPTGVSNSIRSLAVEAFLALGCEGLARADFFLTPDGKPYVNELNTMPGFTKISMYPSLWAQSGKPLATLLDELIQLALERFHAEKNLRTSPAGD